MSSNGQVQHPRKGNPLYYPAPNKNNTTYWKRREEPDAAPPVRTNRTKDELVEDAKSGFHYHDTASFHNDLHLEDKEEEQTELFPAVEIEENLSDPPTQVLPVVKPGDTLYDIHGEYDEDGLPVELSQEQGERQEETPQGRAPYEEEESWRRQFVRFVFSPAGQVVIILGGIAAVTVFSGYLMYLMMS